MFAAMREIVTPEQMEEAVFTDEKQQREENIREITDKFAEAFAENEEWKISVRKNSIMSMITMSQL